MKSDKKCKPMTRPVKIAFISRAGTKLRLPKVLMTKSVKIAFIGRVPKGRLRHTEEKT